MKYRNIVTGIEFETKCLISGDNIVPVDVVVEEKPKTTKQKAKPAPAQTKKKGAKK